MVRLGLRMHCMTELGSIEASPQPRDEEVFFQEEKAWEEENVGRAGMVPDCMIIAETMGSCGYA